MNTFVHIVRLDDWCFRHVRYFSVRFVTEDDEGLTLFHEFMDRMGQVKDADQELDWILNWVEHIGDNVPYPLRDGFFRHERAAMALPPPIDRAKDERRKAKRHDRLTEEAVELEVGQLRLYCHPVNDHVVFLFSGAIKTKGVDKAEDCKVVSPHFKLANVLARRIDQAFMDDDITWTDNRTDIAFDEVLELDL